jgi:hypothetical protein
MAISSFKFAPPRKKDQREMAESKEMLAEHVLERLEVSWEFSQKRVERSSPSIGWD